MGITSFVLFILSALLFAALIFFSAVVLAPALQGIDPQSLQDPQSVQNLEDLPPEVQQAAPLLLILSLGFLSLPVLTLVGLGFGIAGLLQQRRKKLFAGLGTVLNGLALFAVVALFLLGLIGAAGIPTG